MRKHYLVSLKIQIGAYEKRTEMVITTDNDQDAGKMAMALECHGDARYDEDAKCVYDLHGEFAYKVDNIQELTDSECVTLSKYVSSHNYDEDYLNDMLA